MQRAVDSLPISPAIALVDGIRKPTLTQQVITVVKGDQQSYSIAAASIIAKVTRDRLMDQLHLKFPHYGWEKNAGYGTAQHQAALQQFGITSHHRRSFAPIAALVNIANSV
jgi:ribonuclease HII